MHSTNPVCELIAAGLHKLAQPLTASIWLLETASGEDAPPDAERLATELRRASGVLRLLRSSLDWQPQEPLMHVDFCAWLASQLPRWRERSAAAGVTLESEANALHDPPVASAPEINEACDILLDALLSLATSGDVLRVSTAGFRLNLALEFRGAQRLRDSRRLLREMDPFDTRGFDFADDEMPSSFAARGTLAMFGIAASASAETESAAITLYFPNCGGAAASPLI